MSQYIRHQIKGGTYFFTVTLANRKSHALTEHIDVLRKAFKRTKAIYPFHTVAICVLPDHIHTIWQLPGDDGDYAKRWRLIKSHFSRHFPANTSRSKSKVKRREKGIWQRRYWEHQIRSEADLQRHVDYIHFNPVKHGWVKSVKEWPYSSFSRYVEKGLYPDDWSDFIADDGLYGE